MIERVENLTDPNEDLIEEYLRCESVEEAVRRKGGISVPGLHHMLDSYRIVKTAKGIHHRLPDILSFFSSLVLEKISLEGLYRKMPISFRETVSTSALHRILARTLKERPRRYGTALVLTPENFPRQVLIANDIAPSDPSVGRYTGDLSLAMGFRNPNESKFTSVLRIVQREVWKDWAVKRSIPAEAIPQKPKPFMKVKILDVGVDVFHIVLPAELSDLRNFSSFKLANYRYVHLNNIINHGNNGTFRSGILEIASGYRNLINGAEPETRTFTASFLNRELIKLTKMVPSLRWA